MHTSYHESTFLLRLIAVAALLLGMLPLWGCLPNDASSATTTVETAPAIGTEMTQAEVSKACAPFMVGILEEAQPSASGILISADGYILTDYSAVDNRTALTVRFQNGEELPASSAISNKRLGIAVLKVATTGLTPVTFGASDVLEAGDSILAQGFAESAPAFALFNLRGELVGIASADSGSIPVSDLAPVIQRFVQQQLPGENLEETEPDHTLEEEENSDPDEIFEETVEDPDSEYGSASWVVFGSTDLLSWSRINAIPVATDSMSENQLRQICLDFMRLQLTFAWKPSAQFTHSNKTFYTGAIYGGIPYVQSSSGNLYKVMQFYDATTGVLDISGGKDTLKTIGNQCSASAFWAWNRVSNTVRYQGTSDAHEKNGCLRVGGYTYGSNVTSFAKTKTKDICQQNGEQVMYESYALLKPADGIVNYGAAGHMRMISAQPVVVRNPDGTIDGKKSYVLYMDQIANWSESKQADGSPYEIEGGLDVRTTFELLYKDGYLPFTLAELNKQNKVEAGTASLSIKGSSVSPSQLTGATVNANYAVSNVIVSVKDASGNEVFSQTLLVKGLSGSAKMPTGLNTGALESLAQGGNTVEIRVLIGNGQTITAYTGTLTK